MKIYINDNELDFTLENEKNCGDVLNQIQMQLEKDNATIIGIKVNKKIFLLMKLIHYHKLALMMLRLLIFWRLQQ